MAKLEITLFALLLLAVSTYAVRTITVQIDEENPIPIHGSRKCWQQIEEADMTPCKRYLTRPRSGRGGQNIMMMMVAENQQSQASQELLNECCNQMRRLDRECQCEAMEEVRQQESQMGSQEREKIRSRLEKMASRCGVPERCHGSY